MYVVFGVIMLIGIDCNRSRGAAAAAAACAVLVFKVSGVWSTCDF